MFNFIALIGFFGFIILGIMGILSIFKKSGKAKKRFVISFGLFILFMIGAVNSPPAEETAATDESESSEEEVKKEEEQPNEEEENEPEQETEPEPKEELVLSLDSAEYSENDDLITIIGSTNIPDGTEIYVGFKGEDEFDMPVVPDSAEVKDGKLTIVVGDYEDEYDGAEYVVNGEYPINASFSVNTETEANIHLIDELGEYSEFVDRYIAPGEVKETDNGYVVENINLGDIEITNAYTVEEVTNLKLESKKSRAEALDFKQLDKNPDRHAGTYVTYTGEIVEIREGENMTQMRIALDDWYNDIIYVEYDGYTEFVEEDSVTIYGEVFGGYSYTSQAGWEITIPAIIADIVE